MKNRYTKIIYLSFLICLLGLQTFAQTIVLDPSELEPDEDGWYLSGGYVYETNTDGDTISSTFYSGCDDEYEDNNYGSDYDPQKNYTESGTQQDFTYEKCLIMPKCSAKGDAPTVSDGFIQIAPCENISTESDSTSWSYILSPPLENLTEFYMAVACLSTSSNYSKTFFYIDYSTDNGATWSSDSSIFIDGEISSKNGEEYTINSNDADYGSYFKRFVSASNKGPIIIRLSTGDYYDDVRAQPMSVHDLTITADIYTTTAISNNTIDNFFFSLDNRTIISENESLSVYSTMGSLIGKGTEVTVPEGGIYFIRSSSNEIKKVFIP